MRTETSELAFEPIKYTSLNYYYNILKKTFWIPEELDLSTDKLDWEKLDTNTREFIKNILFLFSQLDGIVNENLIEYLKKETSFIKEASHFYAMQEANETIHNETYSLLVTTYISDLDERRRGLDSIQHYPAIRKIADWAWKWMSPEVTTLERLMAFICVEGIIFQNPFAGIFYLKKSNALPGLIIANEWISRDEGVHTNFGIELSKILEREYSSPPDDEVMEIEDSSGGESTPVFEKLSQEKAHLIVREAVNASIEFTRDSMKTDLVGLKADELIEYVKNIADDILTRRGFEKIYNVENPLTWMASVGMVNKSNFFEKKVTEYAKVDVSINYDSVLSGNINF